MNNQEIVAKLWNLCNVLRDDGITYHQYVTELTYILFLKMCKETGTEGAIPEQYRWDKLLAKQGVELKKFYKELLEHLGESCTGRVREIYQGAQSNIDEPKNLEKIIQIKETIRPDPRAHELYRPYREAFRALYLNNRELMHRDGKSFA